MITKKITARCHTFVACLISYLGVLFNYSGLKHETFLSHDGNRKCAVFLFNLSSQHHIYIVRSLFAFFVVEHLTRLKFNFLGTCYTGPVRQTNLALMTRADSKSIVPIEALDRCFSSEVWLPCPKSVVKSLTSLQRFALAWNPELTGCDSQGTICWIPAVKIYSRPCILVDDASS